MAERQNNINDETKNKQETIPSAEKLQIPNKMELIENKAHKD